MPASEEQSLAGIPGSAESVQPSAAAASSAGDTIARGTALAFASKVVGGVFTAALTIFLARKLGAGNYGVFALAMSIVGLVELPSDFGVAVALPRFLAEHRTDRAELWELVRDGIRLEVIGSCVVAAGLVVGAGPLARAYHAPALALAIRGLAIALVGQNYLFFFSGVFTALRRQAANVWASLSESAAEVSATVFLVLTFGGVGAAAFARATGYVFGAAVSVLLALRLLGRGMLPRTPRVSSRGRRIIGYAGRLWVVDSVYTMFTQVDSILIGALLTAGSVSFFSAPARLITVLGYPGYAIASAVSPRLARTGTGELDAPAFAGAIRLLTALMVVATAFTTVWATPIIHLTLGHEYGRAAGVLRALAPYILLTGTATIVSTALNYLGAARRRIPIAVATLLLNLVVDLILIPKIGVLGGAVGSDLGLGFYALAQLYYCDKALEIPISGQLLSLMRCLIAATPAASVLFILGTHAVAIPVLAAGGVAAVLAYVTGLLLTREVSIRELAWLLEQVRRVFRR